MTNKLPVCECGTLLQLIQETVYGEMIKINKNHKLSKRKKIIDNRGGTGCDYLTCHKCGNKYIFDMCLHTKKVIRGDKRI